MEWKDFNESIATELKSKNTNGNPKMITFPHADIVEKVSKLDSYEILFKKFFGVKS